MWHDVGNALRWLWHHTNATGLAAVAAGFSALTAFLTMRIQRDNLRESVRPELVLLRWYRAPYRYHHVIKEDQAEDSDPDTVAFLRVRNAGRGVALSVRLHLTADRPMDRPLMGMGTMTLPLVEAGGEAEVDCRISVWFKNAATFGEEKNKIVSRVVKVMCQDSRGHCYETDHAVSILYMGSFPDEVASGVSLHRSRATMTTAGRMRLRARWNRTLIRLEKLPMLGRALSHAVGWLTGWL